MLSTVQIRHAGRAVLRLQSGAPAARRHMGLLSPLLGSSPGQNGLHEQFGATPELIPMDIPEPTTSSSSLPNGIQFMSEDTRSPLATVTITVGVGSRDTSLATAGTARLLKHLALGTTDNRSKLRIDRELQEIGAAVSTSLSRENLTIQAVAQAHHFRTLAEVLGDAVSNPAIKDYEINETLMDAVLNDIADNGDSTAALSDAIHAAAFYDSVTLGLPLFGEANGASRASAVELAQSATVGSNIRIVGTGVDHDQFAHGLNDHFSGIGSGNFSRTASEYIGGEARVASSGPTQIAVALSTAGATPAAAAVLAAVIGTAVRRPTHRVGGHCSGRAAALVEANDSVGAISGFVNTYSDNGIVGVAATTNGTDVESTFAALANALQAGNISDEEVARAKAVLRGSAALAADSQVGRANAYVSTADAGHATPDAIAAVTSADVNNALQGALATAPSFATVGDITNAPRYNVLSGLFRS